MKASKKMLIFEIMLIVVYFLIIIYNCIIGPSLIAYICVGFNLIFFMLMYTISMYLRIRKLEKDIENNQIDR